MVVFIYVKPTEVTLECEATVKITDEEFICRAEVGVGYMMKVRVEYDDGGTGDDEFHVAGR